MLLLQELVTDPNGRIVNTKLKAQKTSSLHLGSILLKVTLTILNQGSNPVNVDGIFGYLPFVAQDNQVNLSPLNGIITGITYFVIGINCAHSGYRICHY